MTDLPECKYRRRSTRPGFLQLHCFLKRGDCTYDECVVCPSVAIESGRPMEIEGEDGKMETVYFSEVPDPNFAANRLPLVSPDSLTNWVVEQRPDLQAIRISLPPARPGKDRRFTMELDGSIVYEQEEGDWESPRKIKGYERDPENPWRFTPLWPRCLRRLPQGRRTESCGCVQISMTCTEPASELNGVEVSHEQCQQCPARARKREINNGPASFSRRPT